MSVEARTSAALPHALRDAGTLPERMPGRRITGFRDFDGTLTPIADRPQDAVITQSMREVVEGWLAAALCAWSADAIAPSSSD